ncbi:MAG: B12-binding domain-containing radical SAM protein [Planctomycetes bacterium]|nr:B12-binding domain-containing radical SAM protein [Planctomycetota bacterium]
MNALLIYPEFPDAVWSFKHALKFIRKKAYSPPLGLLTVAAMLPSEWTKRLVDLNVTRLADEDLGWADYAFISATSVQRGSVRQVISRCKEISVTVVAGGPLFTTEYEHFKDVDHLVLNEAEVTLPPFLADLERGCARHIYMTSEFANIQKTPVPLWELADLQQYATMSIQFTRGCPYHCEFCNVTVLFGHRSRTKTVGQIIAELDSFYNLGWRGSTFFVDDNFIGNKRYPRTELLPALIEWQKDKVGMPFYTAASINLADDEQLMQMMVEAGFDQVFIGIETPNEESLTECGKKQNKSRNLVEDVKRIQRAGLHVQGGFIVGFDNDTPSIFRRQIDFIQKSGIVMANVAILQAPTGSRLYERLRREGRLLGQMLFDVAYGSTNFVPTMDIATLREGYKDIMRNIYSPEHYYQRVKTFLREYKPPKTVAPLNSGHIPVFFRSIYHLGIIGKERVHYWRLLLWTCFHRPKLFPLAIKLAIYGHHYRKVTELHIL